MSDALVIGAGPAGLMAAEILAGQGVAVTMVEAMPTAGRKFLMAGKSGLNLTKDEDMAAFLAAYAPRPAALDAALRDFGPAEVMAWAQGLGQPVFTGSSGRVFPVAMKASPLLRAWMTRLAGQGVRLFTRWRWTGWDDGAAQFLTPDGAVRRSPRATILALGGASWRRLGSDGAWAAQFPGDTAPFAPANMGLVVVWSAHMAPLMGRPVKGTALRAGATASRGEWVISSRGMEGGGVYAVARAVREGAPLTLDLVPDLDHAALAARMARQPPRASRTERLRRLGLDPVRVALALEWGQGADLKAIPVPHGGPRPMDEAISTAGGLRFSALDGFMLKDRPGVFACGEMLDWEAPTGGYLLTGCLATGRAAGLQAAKWLGT